MCECHRNIDRNSSPQLRITACRHASRFVPQAPCPDRLFVLPFPRLLSKAKGRTHCPRGSRVLWLNGAVIHVVLVPTNSDSSPNTLADITGFLGQCTHLVALTVIIRFSSRVGVSPAFIYAIPMLIDIILNGTPVFKRLDSLDNG